MECSAYGRGFDSRRLHQFPFRGLQKRTISPRKVTFKYRFGVRADDKPRKAEKVLALGVYPDVSLKRAREKRDAARQLVADGIDPSAKRKADE